MSLDRFPRFPRLIAVLWLATMTGCAAQHRRSAGAATMAVAGAGALAGMSIAVGCFPDSDENAEDYLDEEDCPKAGAKPQPAAGAATVGISLGVLLVGAVLYASAEPASADPPSTPAKPSPSAPPKPPPRRPEPHAPPYWR